MDKLNPNAEPLHICDERFARDKDRLDRMEKIQQDLVGIINRLTYLQENQSKQLEKMEERVVVMEKRPSGYWDKLVTGIIAAVTSGVISFAISRVVGG